MLTALARLALRNLKRRPGQAAVVVAGLMVGTSILAGTLVLGASLGHAIRQGAYDGLGPMDHLLQVEGFLLFPEDAYRELDDNATLSQRGYDLAPLLMQDGSLKNPATNLHEPRLTVTGFDAAADARFEGFHLVDGRVTDGRELGPGEVYVDEETASGLGARAGDRLTLSLSAPTRPVLPNATNVTGRLVAAAGPGASPLGGDGYTHSPLDTYQFPFTVKEGALGVAAFAFPTERPVDLDLELVAPDGTRVLNASGTATQPDVPAVVAVPGEVAPGEWTLLVHGKAATDAPFTATIVVFERVWDVQAFLEFTRSLDDADRDRLEDLSPAGDDGGFRQVEVTVKGVVAHTGKADLFLDHHVFLPLREAQRLYDAEGEINAIRASAEGRTESDPEARKAAGDDLEEAVAAVAAAHADDPAYANLEVERVKDRWLDAADRAGESFSEFLAVVGSFTILAGVMLIVNIFVMLAEERRRELGVARALGMRRRHLVGAFLAEGSFYAVLAGAVGVVVGLGLAWALLVGFNDIWGDEVSIALTLRPDAAALAWAFVGGLVLAVGTVAVTAVRVSRLNVVRAIRLLEDPEARPGRVHLALGAVLAAVGIAASGWGLAADALPGKVLGPSLVLVAAGILGARRVGWRRAYPWAGGLLSAYVLASFLLFEAGDGEVEQMMAPLRGMMLVLALVLVVVNLPGVESLGKRLLARVRSFRPVAAAAVAYPTQKRVRTGLTMSMFALVVLVIVAFSALGASFRPDIAAQAGGYDVEATTTAPLGDLDAFFAANGTQVQGARHPLAGVARYDALQWAEVFGDDVIRVDGEEVADQGPPVTQFYAYEAAFVDANAFRLEERDPRYATDADAYRAVLDDPTLVIVSRLHVLDDEGRVAHGVGSVLTLNASGGAADLTIIGVQEQVYFGGVFLHPAVMEANFQRVRGLYLVDVADGDDPAAVARDLEAAFDAAGMEAVAIEEEAERFLDQQRQFLTLFQVYLAFGLVVGTASLGIVTARNAIERRQEVGMLRAIGLSRRDVLRLFLLEGGYVVTAGLAIGVGLGLFLAWASLREVGSVVKLDFVVPWSDLAVIVGVAYATAAAATWYPAWHAAQVPPSEAVRYIE